MKLSAAIRALLSLVLLLAALFVLRRELDALSWPALNAAVRRIPADRIRTAGLLTLLNFAVLTCFDQLAFRHIGRRQRLAPVALTYPRIALRSITRKVCSRRARASTS